jgi:hypothetical protein
MKNLALALVFAAAFGASARAATPLVDQWDTTTMTGILGGLGATAIKPASLGGQPGLLAQTPDGLNMGLYAKGCATAGDPPASVCRGLEGVIGFDPGSTADRAALVDKLNHQYAVGKFMVESDGSIRLTRYLKLDGGVSAVNLKTELAAFLAVATAAKQTLWTAPTP